MYAMQPNVKVGRNPEKPLMAAPTNKKYRGKLRYMIMRITTVSRQEPIKGDRRAGFLRPDLSVHGPQNGATSNEEKVTKKLSPVSIFVAWLWTYGNTRFQLFLPIVDKWTISGRKLIIFFTPSQQLQKSHFHFRAHAVHCTCVDPIIWLGITLIDHSIDFQCHAANFVALWLFRISKIQLVVYHQCCVLIGWATSGLYVIVH